MTEKPRVVKEMPSVELDRDEFERRFRARFNDPLFEDVEDELTVIVAVPCCGKVWQRCAPRSAR